MNILAFDTAADTTVVALQVGTHQWVEHLPGGPKASAELLPSVARLLHQAGTGLAPLDGVAVGLGPGSFTGVRTACAAAQGLALGAGLRVLPIDSLMALAESALDDTNAPQQVADGTVVHALFDARMGELYAARYQRQGSAWRVLQAPSLASPAQVLADGQASDWPCGPGWAVPAVANPSRLVWASAGVSGAGLLRLALQAAAAGAWVPADALEPQYVRNKVAQTTAERQARHTQTTQVAA